MNVMTIADLLNNQRENIAAVLRRGCQVIRRASWEPETAIYIQPCGALQYRRFKTDEGWPWKPTYSDLYAIDWSEQ